MTSITSANSVVTIGVTGIFTSPIQLQQFGADDIFTNEPVAAAETMMGVDGFLAAGFVFAPVDWSVTLMADSPSNTLFDQWYQTQLKNVDVFRATGTVWLPSLGKKFNMVNGVLTRYRNMPDAAKTLRPRTFIIQWQRILPANM